MEQLLIASAAQMGAGQDMTGAGSSDGGNTTPGRPRDDNRDARLADKLRENLKRRKALARRRGDTTTTPDPHAAPAARHGRDTKED